MKTRLFATAIASLTLCAGALLAAPAAQAQNVAVVNGKPVPKARVDAFMKILQKQAAQKGQQLPPDVEQRVRDKIVMDEIVAQEAERRGLVGTPEYKTQMEQARQNILGQALVEDFMKKNPVSDAELQTEYDKLKAQSAGTEYRASHILVEKEDEAKALIAQIKGGASFEELAKKNSKDPGSGAKGGDLDFAAPGSYVPEFSAAMVKLKKGEMTEEPVKTQYGYHIIKLVDTRETKFPPIEEVKPQLKQRIEQEKMTGFVEELRAKAKTDYKFSSN